MAKISWKAGTMLAPVPPALISCGTMEHPNVMTAAWTGIICTEPTLVYVSIRPSRYSHELISQSGEFVINVPTVAMAKAVDTCGVKSGRKVNKFELTGLTAIPCRHIEAPQVQEAPISLECKVREVTHFGTHDMFLAEVLSVNIEETLLDEKKALHLEKAGLLAYAHGFYYSLGKQIGKFGWSVEKTTTAKKRKERQKAEQQTDFPKFRKKISPKIKNSLSPKKVKAQKTKVRKKIN